MWIYFKGGHMVSIVAATERHSKKEKVRLDARGEKLLQVRGRREEDVKLFARACGSPRANVIETPKADYRFRVVLPADRVSVGMARMALEVDYPNFKDTIKEADRKDVASSVWATTLKLDPRNIWDRFWDREDTDDDENRDFHDLL